MDFSPLTQFVKTIPHREWNEEVLRFARSRPLHVRVDRSRRFRHPWAVSAAWDREIERWRFRVHPGFVNTDEILVRMNFMDAPQEAVDRVGLANVPASERIDVHLTEGPEIPVEPSTWRSLGTDAIALNGSFEPVPEFFTRLGVTDPLQEVTTTSESLEVTRRSADQPRLLRAVDIVLQYPRPALTVSYESTDVEVGAQILLRPASGPPSLQVRKQYEPFVGGETSVEQLVTGLVDDGIDELHLSTLYLLSPPGAAEGSDPDRTWSAYARHFVFWNLRHDIDVELESVQADPITFSTLGLAGGAGEGVVQSFLRENNAAQVQMEALLNQSRVRGAFWTI